MPGSTVMNISFQASGPIVLANAEGVQHLSPGQANASVTSVSAALGNGAVQGIGRASDVQFIGPFAEAEMRPTLLHRAGNRDIQGQGIGVFVLVMRLAC